MRSDSMRLVAMMFFMGLLSAAQAGLTNDDPGMQGTVQTTKSAFSIPFSLQSKIISTTEANGLAQFGSTGLTEYVVKQIPGMGDKTYQSFDNSIVVTINGGVLDPRMLAHIRSLVGERVQQRGFSVKEPSIAQAGIASVLSPFRAQSGRITWELLLVVFDRKKYNDALTSGGEVKGLEAVFQSAIRGIVVHLFPETDLDISNGINDQITLDGLRILFDKAFSHFMQPLAATKQKTASESLPAMP